MYAIIQTGGHQVKVTPGSVATMYGTAGEPGAELTLDQVLVVEKDGGEVLAGAPFVANARVVGGRRRRSARAQDSRLQEKAPQGHAPDHGSPLVPDHGAHKGHPSRSQAPVPGASRR